MGLKDCQIALDNPWNTYYPGQTINGTVTYTFDSPKKVRGISIRFKGEAETSWSETESRQGQDGKTTSVTVPYSGKEEYFSISYYLLGTKTGNELEIPAGSHSYPFTCALPPTLPSSFEGEHGFVRYTIKTTLDRPWKFDQETKMAFTVVSHMDLNLNPEYRAPVRMHMEKNFCCCWCKSGPLTVDVEMPVSGYCSGQIIPLDISCENGSKVSVNEIHIELKKIVKFRTTSPRSDTNESKITIAELKLGVVAANSSKNWKESIEVPPLPPSNLANCSLIDLDYELKVNCIPSGMHVSMDTKKAIIIGTVPIAGFQPPPNIGVDGGDMPLGGGDMPVGGDMVPVMPPSAPLMDDQTAAPVLYPSLAAQPSFQEGQFAARSIYDATDSQHMMVNGQNTFAPRYPTYGGYPYPQQ